MKFPRTALSDWSWAGGPFRRFLASLAVSAIVVTIPYLFGSPTSGSLIMMFVGFDLGAWFMDKAYLDRMTRRDVVAG